MNSAIRMHFEDEARLSRTDSLDPGGDDELYRRAVELSRQVPWTSDPDGRILAFGPGWSELIGHNPDIRYQDLLGSGLAQYTHPDDLAVHKEIKRRSLTSGEAYQSEFRLKMPRGAYRWFRSRAGSQRDATGAVVRWYGTIEDIHEHKLTELSHQSHARVLEMVASGRPLPEVLEALCLLAEDRIPEACCSILLFDRDTATLRHGAAPNLPDSYTTALDGMAVGPVAGSCGTAAHERRDVIVTDIALDPLWDRWRDLALSHGLSACWSKPVLARSGEVLGTFAFYYNEPRTPTQDEMTRIDTVLHFAALVIERQRSDAALRESEEHYRHSVELNPQIPWSADSQGNIDDVSPRWQDVTGTPASKALGSGWTEMVHPEDQEPATRKWIHSVKTGAGFDIDYRVRRWDGGYQWVRARAAPRRDSNGSIIRWYGTLEDIHDRKIAKERLQWAAYHDDMTSLPNRRLFGERLREALDRAKETGRVVGLLIMDLDDFKQINDRFGHDIGNEFLCVFGKRLSDLGRPTDTVARLGGDEFALILADVAGEDEVLGMAKMVHQRMQEPIRLSNGSSLDCRISSGGAVSVGGSALSEDFLKEADLALYAGKAEGRGTFKLFHPTMREEAQRVASALELARSAISSERIVPFYQPKVIMASGVLGGFEALLRWHDDRSKIRSPMELGPAFEDTELGIAIGQSMRRAVFQDLRKWLDAGLGVGRVAINASAAEFRHDDYAERVLGDLDQAGVPPSNLEVEVTESVFLGRGAWSIERALGTLKAAGVTIALDDFGTGFASLTHLKKYPVDVIKIDRSFVSDMEEDAGNAAIVRAVMGLGRSLGIEVVAEGVESATQASILTALGCDIGQGYYFGRPMPTEVVPEFVLKMPRT